MTWDAQKGLYPTGCRGTDGRIGKVAGRGLSESILLSLQSSKLGQPVFLLPSCPGIYGWGQGEVISPPHLIGSPDGVLMAPPSRRRMRPSESCSPMAAAHLLAWLPLLRWWWWRRSVHGALLHGARAWHPAMLHGGGMLMRLMWTASVRERGEGGARMAGRGQRKRVLIAREVRAAALDGTDGQAP